MSSNPSEQLTDGTTIVTVDGVAARQIEIYLAQQHLVGCSELQGLDKNAVRA